MRSLWGGGQLPQSRYQNNRTSDWVCWPTSTLPGYRETNIIVLGTHSNHHICPRFRSSWCQDIADSSSLERKMKVCNTNRRDDVARFSGNELRQQAPKHELVLLHPCEHVVPDKHDHMVVLQQNTTEFWQGTIINDIEVSTRKSKVITLKHTPLS